MNARSNANKEALGLAMQSGDQGAAQALLDGKADDGEYAALRQAGADPELINTSRDTGAITAQEWLNSCQGLSWSECANAKGNDQIGSGLGWLGLGVGAKTATEVEQGVKGTGGTVDNAAHNAASYAGLQLDLKTTEAANTIVDSLRGTGQLPSNYVTKAQAAQEGWQPGKALNNSVPNGQMGGDVFANTTNILPSSAGRTWFEADIGLNSTMSRSNQPGTRLLYSNDGLLYITTDHYKTVTSIGSWK